MLTLYRKSHCPAGDDIEQQLRESTLAYRVVNVDDPAAIPAAALPPDAQPPLLGDSGRIYVGSEGIAKHLEELTCIKRRMDRFGADACYCDGDGNVL